MIDIDQLEVLLRTIPQFFLFGGISLLLFGWIDKKPKLSLIGEAILVLIGIAAFLVMLSGAIPSPTAPGMNEAHIKPIINMLVGLSFVGFLAAISLVIRLVRKQSVKWLVFVVFLFAAVVFFQSTKLAKVGFELNRVTTEQVLPE